MIDTDFNEVTDSDLIGYWRALDIVEGPVSVGVPQARDAGALGVGYPRRRRRPGIPQRSWRHRLDRQPA